MQIDFTAISGLLYLSAMVLYTGSLFFSNANLRRVAFALCVLGIVIHGVAFITRWHTAVDLYGGSLFRSIPITNLYESLQFFALMLMVVYLVFEFKSKISAMGAFVSAVSGALLLFIDIIGASGQMQPLVPALQSNWLLAHVSLSFIAYVFFAFSAISAFIFLILTSEKRKDSAYIFWTVIAGLATAGLFALIFDAIIACFNGEFANLRLFSATINNSLTAVKLMFLFFSVFIVLFFWYEGINIRKVFNNFKINVNKLDEFAYKFAVLGFIVFTIGGLIFGAIWAEQAWGRYWSWDPKETWAFVTWVVYGIYLHGRLSRKWSKQRASIVAVVGFILTIFTFLGVNLLLSGLHSYGSL